MLPKKLLALTFFGIAVTALFSTRPAQAGYIVTLKQVGSDVVATGSGAVDLTGLTLRVSGTIEPGVITANIGIIQIGGSLGDLIDQYTGITGPTNFGSGNTFEASTNSGDLVGIFGLTGDIDVPHGYVSDTPLSDSMTFNNATFSSLGVTPGTYEWTWGTGLPNQNFTLIIGGGTPTPTPPPPLTIIQPNGGEVWLMGSVHEIKWDRTDLKHTDHFTIHYSRDGGATWFRIAQNIPAFAYGYWWQVDNFPTTQGRVKIFVQEDRSITDQSDANFTVQRSPYITLLRPNGGEVWMIGQYQNIHWNRQNPGGNTVDIDYSTDNGTTWIRIATQAEDTGWYLWNVPGPATTTATVRIRFHESPSVTDMSDAVFTIVSP